MLLLVAELQKLIQCFPYDDFIASHDAWLFIKVPGDQQPVYV